MSAPTPAATPPLGGRTEMRFGAGAVASSAIPSSALTSARIVGKRSSGRFCIARAIAAPTCAGTSARRVHTSGGTSSRIEATTPSAPFSACHGRRPASAS